MKKFLFEAGITVFLLGIFSVLALPSLFPTENNTITQTPSNTLPSVVPTEMNTKKEMTLFFDLACAHCKEYYKETFAKFWKEHKENVIVSFQHFPTQTEGLGMELAKFFDCAKAQGKTEKELLDFFYFGMETPDLAMKKEWEQKLELKSDLMLACEKDEKITEKIEKERNDAKEKGVRGTPSIGVKGRILEGKVKKTTLEAF